MRKADTKSVSRNFLEPSGPVQACNGTALPLPFTLIMVAMKTKMRIFNNNNNNKIKGNEELMLVILNCT